MAIVNQVEKKMKLDHWSIIKFQILTYCFTNKIQVSDADLDCLTLLAIEGQQELTSFCIIVFKKNIFKSAQTVRNAITKAEKKHLIVKEGKNKKKILLNPSIEVYTKGSILLDYKFLALEA